MFYHILNREMELAVGCTEPGAIALTGAYAGVELAELGNENQRIEANASDDIVKNTKTEGIRNSNASESPHAAAIGEVRAEPGRKLEVMNGTAQDRYTQAEALAQAGWVLEYTEKYGVQCNGARHCSAPKISGRGITAQDPENSINHFTMLGNEGSGSMDSAML